MSFKEKVDKVLKFRKLNINKIELKLEVDGTFRKAYNDDREPKEELVLEFLRNFQIRKTWWDDPKGSEEQDIFEEKSTYVEIPKHNNGNGMTARETFYTDLIENNSEYSLLPRAVFKDYKIVPERILDVIIKSADSEKQALIEKHELIIEGLKNKINRLESEKEELQRQIPAKNKS